MRELFDIVDIVGVALEILIAVNFFNAVAHKKELTVYRRILICISLFAVQSLIIVAVEQQMLVSINAFLMIVVVSILYDISWGKRWLFSIAVVLFLGLSEVLVGLLLAILSKAPVEYFSKSILYYIQGVLISKLMVYILIKFISYFSVKLEVRMSKRVFIPLVTLPLASFMITYIMAQFVYEAKPSILLVFAIIAIIFLIVANILVFYLLEYQLKITQAKNEEQIIRQQLEHKAEYYKELSFRQKITNKTMHDLKNQLFALRDIYSTNPTEGMKRIDAICEEISSAYTLKFTGIEAVDALITSKLITMNDNNIKFSNSIYISDNNVIDVMDLCVLLGNLLDNAIEANMNEEVLERFIILNMAQQMNYMNIRVYNSKNEYISHDLNNIITTKKNRELHGFGLKSVDEIVKKYDGNCTFKQSDDTFEVLILIKNK